ncbi:MAG: hypothetical protein HYY84_15165 [Deltaproteobacteria bacterium]|nr:hypothetical protein [Deltaproteobacteria bacterium]
MKRSILLVVLMASFLATGCALLKGGGGGGGSSTRDAQKELKEAQANKDVAALQKLCDDDSLGDPQSSAVPMNAPNSVQMKILANRRARGQACREIKALAGDKDDGNCATVVKRYEEAGWISGESHADHYAKWARRFVKCNNFAAIFENLAHRGDYGKGGEGVKLLQSLEKDGVPVVAEFVKYAKTHKGRRFLRIKMMSYAANHIGNWLVEGGHLDHCGVLSAALADADELLRAGILFYFTEAKCMKEGRALGVGLLAADRADSRRLACANLASTGDASVLKKLRIVSDSDGYNVVQERRGGDGRIYGVRVYPVREACKQAMGKIQLREP